MLDLVLTFAVYFLLHLFWRNLKHATRFARLSRPHFLGYAFLCLALAIACALWWLLRLI